MGSYTTKQRKTIFDFLRKNVHKQFTVKQIGLELEGKGISVSTLYRNLKYLEQEGYIKCILNHEQHGNEILYQYISKDTCACHIHAICNICATTFHLEDSQEHLIKDSLANSQRFAVDTNKTIIYGVCAICNNI